MQFLFTIGGTILAWVIVMGQFYVFTGIPRFLFYPWYYTLHVFAFALIAQVARKEGISYSAVGLAVIITGLRVSLDLFYGVFINPAFGRDYLTTVHWIIPVILSAFAIYLTALFAQLKKFYEQQ